MAHYLLVAGIKIWVTVALILACGVPGAIRREPVWARFAQRWPAATCASFAVVTVSWPILIAFNVVMKLTEPTKET